MNNTTGSVWQPVTVTATGLTTVTGNIFVGKTPEVFSYDLDGNMTSDGRWNYTWDAENRLIKVESRPDTPSSSWRRIEWTYDALGRRIQQVTLIWTNNAWFVVENLKYVSDPMLFGRHIVELNGTNNTLVRSYVWGLDLSRTMDGAGGVGGLLWVTLHTASGPASGTHFVCYDGNGNIVSLVCSTTGDVTGRYEYGPFGEPIRVTGPAATLNPFRFSTKRTDPTTELVLYEYRAYQPSTGRWLNRDHIGEIGGINIYGIVENGSIDFVDFNGLTTVKKHVWSITQQQAMSGIWGWTDLELKEEKPAKLKINKKLCLCEVTKKPEMVFTISVQTAQSGKQSWKENAVFDGITYPDTIVYFGSGLASFSNQHEEKRFQAWKKALTSFWSAHYEEPAAKLTAPTCDELKAKIDVLRKQAGTEWETSTEGFELIRRLFEIGQEGASVLRWVRKSGFGSVSVVYDTN